MQQIENYDFTGKKAIVRVDFNVPLNENQEVTDDSRILATIPTIKKITERGAVILMSHLGRPKGRDEKFSLKHIIPKLIELTGNEIKFADDCIGESAVEASKNLKNGEILLLENLRFHSEEKKGDRGFAEQLAELADVYVNDAFGTAHRAHASTAVIAEFFPDDKMFGYVINGELESLEQVLLNPKKPFTAILGGAKVSTKITVIEKLMKKVDNLIIGGAMTFTFIKSQGGKVGNSLVEDEFLETAKELIQKAKENNINFYFPVDSINADEFSADANTEESAIDNIKDGWFGLDVGKDTIKKFTKIIENSGTVLWNGPVGVFEIDKFANGTIEIAKSLVRATEKGVYTLVGGGDSVAALKKYNYSDKVSYVSTGGGAMLEYLEGKELPGIKAIKG